MSAPPPTLPVPDGAATKAEHDFESEVGTLEDGPPKDEAVHFCLLAEFDIDAGATLTHQYPYPTGTDDQ